MGDSQIVLAGGSDSMSQAPYAVRNIRFGTKLGVDIKLEDMMWAALTDFHCKTPMGITAENLAEKYNISREDVDKFSLRSQMNWKNAHENGVFKGIADLFIMILTFNLPITFLQVSWLQYHWRLKRSLSLSILMNILASRPLWKDLIR